MARQIALLRGINVGGSKKVAMAALREVFSDLGHSDVKTYVNSGNVVFSGPTTSAKKLEAAIEAAFGFDVAVVVRTRGEIADVVAANPLREVAADPSRYLVLFSGGGKIDPARAADVETGAGEQLAIRGAEAYLWLPDGIHASPLARAMNEKRLGVTLTGRNWRTVEKLLELADG
ncbi:MAG TPA: DUF1697 domain-containing protein [Baekduia sp.]|nr:DUF1697 domain-containing protein [Baekduia sp.]